MEIKMLTERKQIDVSPGVLVGQPDRVYVDVCLDCGAVVFDVVRHDRWHVSQEVGQ